MCRLETDAQSTWQTEAEGLSSNHENDLLADIKLSMGDEQLHDVYLEGNDGGRIPASRFVLATRSKVFKKMFFGGFVESKVWAVPLDFRSSVLEAVVSFCYTDQPSINAKDQPSMEEWVRVMVGLVAAGHYLELSRLEKLATRRLCSLMGKNPTFACVVLDEGATQGARTETLTSIALDVVRLRGESALLTSGETNGLGVTSLRESLLRDLIVDDSFGLDQVTLFRCVKQWSEARKGDSSEMESSSQASFRETQAKRLVEMLDLTLIAPSILSEEVTSSGLVKSQRLLDVYKSQVLQAEKRRPLVAPSALIPASPDTHITDQLLAAYQLHAVLAENEGSICASSKRACHKKSCLVVHGAGVAAVNGTYFKVQNGSKYTKRSIWQGREVLITIVKCASSTGVMRWWIFTAPENGPTRADERIYFYRADEGSGTPLDSWIVMEGGRKNKQGIHPPPIVVVVPSSPNASAGD